MFLDTPRLTPQELISYSLPNVKKLFLPDPGHMICEMDLDRADAQVVAWESGCANLKRAFREALDIHTLNASIIFSCSMEEVKPWQRKFAKVFCHGTNYGSSARTISAQLNIPFSQACAAQEIWFDRNPEIKTWQEAIEFEMQSTRSITNIFGYTWRIFGRLDIKTRNECLAWKPQSTVAHVIDQAWENIDTNLPDVEVLMQVHDSLVMQFPRELFPGILYEIERESLIPCPYENDPLIIPVGFEVSNSSWGDVKEYKLREAA